MLTTSAPTEKERIMNKMDEYIKKNALYEKIAQLEEFSRDRYLETPSNSPCRPRYMAELVERTYFKRIIADFPAADVAPVRHGRWENGNPICPVCGGDKFKDLDADIWCDWQPAFCPNCGAKMDERNE